MRGKYAIIKLAMSVVKSRGAARVKLTFNGERRGWCARGRAAGSHVRVVRSVLTYR